MNVVARSIKFNIFVVDVNSITPSRAGSGRWEEGGS